MEPDARAFVRSLGYGPELSEFPIKLGQRVIRDDFDYNDGQDVMQSELVNTIKISEGTIWLYTISCGRYGIQGTHGKGYPLLLGTSGNVYRSREEMTMAHKYFLKTGKGLPHEFFILTPSNQEDSEKPPVPYFTPQSNSVLGTWYFGTVKLAPERPGNLPYEHSGELISDASDKFIWVEDKESGREFFCMVGHTSEVAYICDCAVNCSFYFPYKFFTSNYGFNANVSPWIARARPKHVQSR